MMWFWIGVGVFFLVLLAASINGINGREDHKPDEVEHIYPGWHTSDSGWERIRICRSCGARGGHWDHMFCVRPCRSCGADSSESYDTTGKWDKEKKQWLTRREIQAANREAANQEAKD